jgi:hypothetical protein
VQAVRANLAAIDRTILELGRDLQIAHAARGEFEADVRALNEQQFALRRSPPVQFMDDQGFEQWGASPGAQRQYQQIGEAIKTREREYQQWVAARQVNYNDGPIPASWSPRNPNDVERRIGRLRIAREVTANELREMEAQLSPGQKLALGDPAPDLVEHTRRVAAGRERAGVGG